MTDDGQDGSLNPWPPPAPWIDMRFGADRTVDEMWSRLLIYRKHVADLYDGSPLPGSLGLRYLVDDTMGLLWHFAECLPAPFDVKARTYRRETVSLCLAGTVANTAKHAGRDSGKVAGGGYRLIVNGRRYSLLLAWVPPSQDTPDRDALDLIDSCLDEWRQFMRDRGVKFDDTAANR